MYSLYFVQNIINLKILKEFYCESYLQSQKFHTNSGKLNLTLLLNLLTLFMTFGILISGAIPAPFDLAMSTNSSKVTKEYLLSKLGLSPLVMVIWVIKFPKIRYIHFLTNMALQNTFLRKIQNRITRRKKFKMEVVFFTSNFRILNLEVVVFPLNF